MKIRFRHLPDGRMFVPSRGQPPEPPPGYVRDPRNKYMFRPVSAITNEETSMRELYQHLYDDRMLCYGSAKHNRCPGVKFYKFYKNALKGKIIDLGCGRGDTVHMLWAEGYDAAGIDQVDLDNGMTVGDITEPLDLSSYDTSLCIDVFEHLEDEALAKVLVNMAATKTQIISVHTGRAFEIGCKTDLHPNKKTFAEWDRFISAYLTITRFYEIGKRRGIYFCTSE